jgi:hypothetical protein
MNMPLAVTLAVLSLAGAAQASPALTALSYDMNNGHGQASGGSFNYWDLAYSGSGSTSTDNAPLSGGLGDLTDGVITTSNWIAVENPAGTGPYVGWRQGVLPGSVPITFHFGGAVSIDTISIHADDSGGLGGVSLPSAVLFTWDGGGSAGFPVVDPDPGTEPSWLVFSGLGIAGTSWVGVALSYGSEWVFIDEVSFNGAPVPEPDSRVLLAAGMGALGWLALRRR